MTLEKCIKYCFFLLLVLSMTAACFAGNRPTPTAVAPDPNSAPAQPPTAATDNTTVTLNAAPGEIGIIEEVTSIERYRMRITVVNEVPNRTANIQIDAAYIKEPPAEEITMQIDENGETQTVTMMLVDGLRYMRSGEMVVQTADARMNLQELTLIQPRDATQLSNHFVVVGEETVHGRATIHYQGGPEAVPTGGTAGDTFDVTGIESAGIDLWVDQAENFIVAMAVKVAGFAEEPAARMEMRFEYFDFNSPDIIITAPADALSMSGGMPGSADAGDKGTGDVVSPADNSGPEPRNALGKLLGFDLLLATGSEITLASNQIVQVSSVYTVDEAANLFQTQLPANGYSLMSSLTPQAGEHVLMFQKGAQITTVQLTATDKGSDWSVVMAP